VLTGDIVIDTVKEALLVLDSNSLERVWWEKRAQSVVYRVRQSTKGVHRASFAGSDWY
jgi:hypothetical protein